MGIKLGPKLELSFWAIGYIVLALVLLIVNISWIAGSLTGILHGMKERNVFLGETTLPTAEYIDTIQKLLADPALDKVKREALTARAARLSYNLGKVDTARTLYTELTKSANIDVKTRAQISLIALDLEAVPVNLADNGPKMAAATKAITELNELFKENQNSTELMAARGAVLMHWFGSAGAETAVAQVSKLVKDARAQEKNLPGNVEARRNLLLMELALAGFEMPPPDEARQVVLDDMRKEARKIAPYIKDTQKTPLAAWLEEFREKADAGALGPPTLNKVQGLPNLTAQESSMLANTIAPAVAASLATPNGGQNLAITTTFLKRAITVDAGNPLNYENLAALHARNAMLLNDSLNKTLADLRANNTPLPIPFGNSSAGVQAVNTVVGDMEKSLNDAYQTLNSAVAETRVPSEPKAEFCRRMVNISLWRATLQPEAQRIHRYGEALNAASLWQNFDPKSVDMMMATAEIYQLRNEPAKQAEWLEKLKSAGVDTGGLGTTANRFEFVTFFPGNPLQIGGADCAVRDQAVLIGCTIQVTGYTNTVDANTVKVTLNGVAVPTRWKEGCCYALIPASGLAAQNKLDFKLALSPQLQKAASIAFKFDSK